MQAAFRTRRGSLDRDTRKRWARGEYLAKPKRPRPPSQSLMEISEGDGAKAEFCLDLPESRLAGVAQDREVDIRQRKCGRKMGPFRNCAAPDDPEAYVSSDFANGGTSSLRMRNRRAHYPAFKPSLEITLTLCKNSW